MLVYPEGIVLTLVSGSISELLKMAYQLTIVNSVADSRRIKQRKYDFKFLQQNRWVNPKVFAHFSPIVSAGMNRQTFRMKLHLNMWKSTERIRIVQLKHVFDCLLYIFRRNAK